MKLALAQLCLVFFALSSAFAQSADKPDSRYSSSAPQGLEQSVRQDPSNRAQGFASLRKDLDAPEDFDGTIEILDFYDEEGIPLTNENYVDEEMIVLPGPVGNVEAIMNDGNQSALTVNSLVTPAGITNGTVALVEPLLHGASVAAISEARGQFSGVMDSARYLDEQASKSDLAGVTARQLKSCVSTNQEEKGMKFAPAYAACVQDYSKNSKATNAQGQGAVKTLDFEGYKPWDDSHKDKKPSEEQKFILNLSEELFFIDDNTPPAKADAIKKLRENWVQALGDIEYKAGDPESKDADVRRSTARFLADPRKKFSEYIERRTRVVYDALFSVMNRKCVFLAVEDPAGGTASAFDASDFKRGVDRDGVDQEMKLNTFWYSEEWIPDEILQDLMIKGAYSFKPAFGDMLYRIVVGKKMAPGLVDCGTLAPLPEGIDPKTGMGTGEPVDYEGNGSANAAKFLYGYWNFTNKKYASKANSVQNIFREVARYIAKGQALAMLLAAKSHIMRLPGNIDAGKKSAAFALMNQAMGHEGFIADVARQNLHKFAEYRENVVRAEAVKLSGKGGEMIMNSAINYQRFDQLSQ